MRAIGSFLISSILEKGLGQERAEALKLYAIYTGLVYITPIGGFLADKYLGYRNAIILGAFLMTLGHASLAFEGFGCIFLGLGLIILGNGFFKPIYRRLLGNCIKTKERKRCWLHHILHGY